MFVSIKFTLSWQKKSWKITFSRAYYLLKVWSVANKLFQMQLFIFACLSCKSIYFLKYNHRVIKHSRNKDSVIYLDYFCTSTSTLVKDPYLPLYFNNLNSFVDWNLIFQSIFKLVESIEKKIKAGHADKDVSHCYLFYIPFGSEQVVLK